jgi:hypothetical protein
MSAIKRKVRDEDRVPASVAEEAGLEGYSELLKGFKERAAEEAKRFDEEGESDFYSVLCFASRAQRDEFASKIGIKQDDNQYLDGLKVAAKFGINIESTTPPLRRTHSFGSEYLKRIIK